MIFLRILEIIDPFVYSFWAPKWADFLVFLIRWCDGWACGV